MKQADLSTTTNTRTIGFWYTDDYGRFRDGLPTYVVIVDRTNDYATDVQVARDLGAEVLSKDLRTGFVQAHLTDIFEQHITDIKEKLEADLAQINEIKF